MVILTAENQKERLFFFQRDSIHILVSHTVKTRKFKWLYFRNETCYGTGNLYKDIFFCLSSTHCKQEFVNPRFTTLQFDDVTVNTICTWNWFFKISFSYFCAYFSFCFVCLFSFGAYPYLKPSFSCVICQNTSAPPTWTPVHQ